MRLERGSITVFICILLSVLIPLCGILTDLARYNEAVSIAQTSLRISVESMLAAYDRQLREQYGLFAVYPRDVESIEKEIYELLSDNLTPESAEGNVTDLFRFKVRRVEVIPIYNLSEPYVLEQQVAEFMKYRAPIQAVSEFVEKLKNMINLEKESRIVEQNMELDKLLNDLRSEMVYFSLLMDKKMKKINSINGTGNFTGDVISKVESNNEKEKSYKPKQETIDNINLKMSEYKEAKAGFERAKKAYDSAESSFKSVESRMTELQSRLEAAKSKAELSENENGSQDSSGSDSEIHALENQIAELQEEYNSRKAERDEAHRKYTETEEKLEGVENELDSLLNQLLNSYKNMLDYTMNSSSLLTELWKHLQLHENYCTTAVELAYNIASAAGEMESDVESLKKAIRENPESAVAKQIGADLEKKVLSIDTSQLSQIIRQLESNKEEVAQWVNAAADACGKYSVMVLNLSNEIGKIEKLIKDKGDGSQAVSMYTGNDNNTSLINDMKDKHSGLASYSEMKSKGTYVIPDYSLTPPPTDKEQQVFEIWHANTFEGRNLSVEEETENQGLENARQKIGEAAKTIAGGSDNEGQNEGDEEDSKSLDDLKDDDYNINSLPSKGGVKSSDDSLAQISEYSRQTGQERFVVSNPLDDPVQGADKVNESEKGFFDYELERIRKLFSTIGELVKDSGEPLLKNLYLNEYIVSAFKNYTTKNNVPENDIGWLRPLDKTYFDKAEVEYIIFGYDSEKSNIAAARRTITVIRMAFNLLHVYSDPEKVATAFSIASTIAGWTIFGVPIVQNFILVGWAALESWIDAGKLMSGEEVPLIKTSQSWFLDKDTLGKYLINNAISSLKDLVKDKAEKLIDKGAESLEETVVAFISGQLDEIFASVTENWSMAAGTVSKDAENLVNSIDFNDLKNIGGDTLESLLESLKNYMNEKLTSFCSSIKDKGDKIIAECKTGILNRIKSALFESDAYKNLLSKVKGMANDAISKGFDAVTNKVSEVLGASGSASSGASNVMGRIIMMDYTDYLRLMLLAVPEEKKTLRCADLIQLNMHTALPDNAKELSRYNTALYVRAWIDIDLWVIPEGMFKKGKEAMIVVEWSQGY